MKTMMWLAYAKAGKEFEVVQALSEEGITVHCARKVDVKRVGKRRTPDVFVEPLLPNYLFIVCDDSQYLTAVGNKHLAGTMTMVPTGDKRAVIRFMDKANDAFNERMAKIDAGERLEQFKAGDLLNVLEGPLAGLTARFRAIMDNERDVFPTILADVDMMGQQVRVSFDPISVRAAE